MKNRLSIKLCQKNTLTEKKYEKLRRRAKIPPHPLTLAAGAIILNAGVKKTSKKLFYRLTPIYPVLGL